MSVTRVGGSFRDPDGFLFERDGVLFRQVQPSYADDWQQLHDSGLLAALQSQSLLVAHEEESPSMGVDADAFRVIRPTRIPFVSYPYEWTPGQLRSAALLTLQVQRLALAHGMTLKDASAYNVQFLGHRPCFIDTLSFTRHHEGTPWAAYRQFCQHFLAPLALMHLVDPRLRDLLRSHLDGIPLDLASRLLPRSTWLRPALLLHLHMHAQGIRRHAGRSAPAAVSRRGVSRDGLEGILGHLESAVTPWGDPAGPTEWGDYESEHTYSAAGQQLKEATINTWVRHAPNKLAFDLGANAGHYSQLLANAGTYTVAIDGDLGATARLVNRIGTAAREDILPLWLDLANPSPAQGWAHGERASLAARGPADLVLALALVHHLAIGNNVPLPGVAAMLADLGTHAIVEWVPKDDPQAQRLLVSRADIFTGYTEEALVRAFETRFRVEERIAIPDGARVLYRLQAR